MRSLEISFEYLYPLNYVKKKPMFQEKYLFQIITSISHFKYM